MSHRNEMIGNPAITLGVMAIFLALCDGAVLPEFRPDREIECHCYNNAATASMIRPVCGTDGRTYQNMCVFVCFQKEYEDLDLKHNGECVENYETYEESEEITEDCYCTKEINPVCGTDNKTYKNTCYLNCRASDTKDLKLKQHGSCEDLQPSEASDHTLIDCPCTREINPVCGSDAKTYPNFCILNCHSHYFKDLKLKHHGECENNSGKEIPKLEVEDCFCSKEINHVCGTDSKTYQNLCMLNCRSRDTKDLKVKHHGACKSSELGSTKPKTKNECFCSKEINHVCGTDSKTYQNLCILNCHSRDTKDLKLKHDGECDNNSEKEISKLEVEDCFCSKEVNHVCGTDSKTYQNLCMLNCRSRDTKDLKVKHHGVCNNSGEGSSRRKTSNDCFCSKEINHVCGTDSKTYQNLCILNCHSRDTKDLKLKHHGECENNSGKEISKLEVEDCFCSKEINHVCGTDSKTYQNLCMLNCRSRDTKDLKVKHHGICESYGVGSTKDKTANDCFCSKEINHVCGTDSKTYQNLCILNCHSRDTKDLKLSHLGHCDEE